MVLGHCTSLLLLHCGQTALWALEVQGIAELPKRPPGSSAGWRGERICVVVFFNLLCKTC